MGMEQKSLSERLPEEIFNRIHEDVGKLATCWSNIEGAGQYNYVYAADVALDLCRFIADKLDEARRDAGEHQGYRG